MRNPEISNSFKRRNQQPNWKMEYITVPLFPRCFIIEILNEISLIGTKCIRFQSISLDHIQIYLIRNMHIYVLALPHVNETTLF